MALTIYLTATLLVLAAARTPRLPIGQSLTTAFFTAGAVLTAQGLFSVPWLRRYRQGPAGWLWRWATWARRPPLRAGSSATRLPVVSGPVRYATAVDGTRIWYDTLGEGEPLLLLNGQSLDHRMWDGVHTELARRHRVVRVDLRGTGDSDAPVGEPYSMRLLAGDALAVLDELGIARAHVYGFSMGGKIAQTLAATAPDRVGALVLGATAPGGSHEVERPAESTHALRRANTEEGRGLITHLFFTPDWAAAHPETVAVIVPRNPPRAQRRHYEASLGHDGWGLLPGIQAPTLVLHGEDDELTPVANAALLAERVLDARLRTLPGARHGYLHEEAAKATREVLDFLEEHPSAD